MNITAARGWRRIGVVLSGAWGMFVLGWASLEIAGFGVSSQFVYRNRHVEIVFYENIAIAVVVPILILWFGGFAVRWIYAGFNGDTSDGTNQHLASTTETSTLEMTWRKLWMLAGILFVLTAIGIIVKLYVQSAEFEIVSIWALFAILLLTTLIMLLFFVAPAIICLAIKKFDVSAAWKLIVPAAVAYLIAVALALLMVPPL